MLPLLLPALALAAAPAGPCDIFAAGGTPCVAAHSTVRALFAAFSGALYTVQRYSDNATLAIAVLSPGGFANAAAQDAFCSAGPGGCSILRIMDQSPLGNHLDIAPVHVGHTGFDQPVNASRDALQAGGQRVYSAYFEGGMGYRNDATTGMAAGDEAQSIYMVTSGVHYNDKCCFDYGNAELVPVDAGPSTMEALYFGSAKGGLNHGGAGPGPWIMADLEKGLFGCNSTVSQEPTISHAFVTAMLKGDSGASPGHFALKGGDAQAGPLRVYWDGPRPPLYAPMKKQGAIILGIGGDNSMGSAGTFCACAPGAQVLP
jgi:hypothetical protein